MMVAGPKSKKSGQGGFTLLEVVIVIGIMGMLAAMIVPFTGYLNKTQRIKLTREKMESIRTALVGPQNIYDQQGAPVIGGYVGHMDQLPKLYRSEWNDDKKTWVWREDESEEIYGPGQPRGLWLRGPAAGDISPAPADAPDYANWLGPYLAWPADPYPGDTKSLDWNNDGHKHIFEQRQVEGKLSDAWGRVLYFTKEGVTPDITLLVVSAGPDGKILLPDPEDANPSYDEGAAENRDNIVMKIPHSQWYSAGQPDHEERTRRSLERIRDAIVGPTDAYDPSGRRLVGGYTGDTGQWPVLWEWDGDEWVSGDGVGQPRGLWSLEDEDEEKELPHGQEHGFAWQGPYLNKPWGQGKNEVLRDAWGTPLHFEMAEDPEGLYMISFGRDKVFDDGEEDGDDIELWIPATAWQAPGMVVKGVVVNDTPKKYVKEYIYEDEEEEPVGYQWKEAPPHEQPAPIEVTLRLYHRPGDDPLEVTMDVPPGESRSFKLPETESDYICGGRRVFEAEVTDEINAEFVGSHPGSVFIGAGTQSPAPEKLVLTVRAK